jgi:hypothetical protein
MRRLSLFFVSLAFAATLTGAVTDLVTSTSAAVAGTATLRFSVSSHTVTAGAKVVLRSVSSCPFPTGASSSSPPAVSLNFGYVDQGSYNFIQGWEAAESPSGAWSSTWTMPALGHVAGGAGYGGSGDLAGQMIDIVPGTYYFTASCLGPNEATGAAYGQYGIVTVTLRAASSTGTSCVGDATETPYECGETLAKVINQLAATGKFDEASSSLETGAYAAEIAANETDGFASGLMNNLSRDGISTVVSLLGYYTGRSAPTWAKHIESMLANAYAVGKVKSAVSGAIASNLVSYEKAYAVSDQSLFLGRLQSNPTIASNFLVGLSESDIVAWSNADQGVENVADAVVNDNWQGYANYHRYAGPFNALQLAGLMYAGTRDNTGRAAVTEDFGPWFIAHGGTPELSSSSWFKNFFTLAAWVAQLTNINGAIASPTGAYLQNAEDWIQVGKFVAGTVAVYFLTALAVDLVWGWITADVASAAGSTAMATALDAGSDFGKAIEDGIHAADDTSEMVHDSIETASHIYDLYDDGDTLANAISHMNATDGIKAEMSYYMSIMGNTIKEAIGRLIQEGVIINDDLAVVPKTTAEIDEVFAHSSEYYVIASAGADVLTHKAIEEQFPVSIVVALAVIFFEGSH